RRATYGCASRMRATRITTWKPGRSRSWGITEVATFFPTPADFRKWLAKNHGDKLELLVGYYKKGSGKPSMTWPQSVDEALCFGWIDGVRRSLGEDAYTIRFTPRRPGSTWSSIN